MAEAWLSGPVEGVPPLLQPVAHALLQAGVEARQAAAGLTPDHLWLRPGGAASIGFHIRHAAGALDRLLSYASGHQLTAEQLHRLQREGAPGDPPETATDVLGHLDRTIAHALATLRATPEHGLLEPREVGRARLPSNVLGLLFHAAEHTQRHAGQVVTTARILRGLSNAATAAHPPGSS